MYVKENLVYFIDYVSIFQLTVLQGDLVNVAADAIVHPTNNTFYMGGEVGKSHSTHHRRMYFKVSEWCVTMGFSNSDCRCIEKNAGISEILVLAVRSHTW